MRAKLTDAERAASARLGTVGTPWTVEHRPPPPGRLPPKSTWPHPTFPFPAPDTFPPTALSGSEYGTQSTDLPADRVGLHYNRCR